MTNKKVPKSSYNYYCENCKYSTSRQSQYNRHIMTPKHKILTDTNKKVPKSSKKFQNHISVNMVKYINTLLPFTLTKINTPFMKQKKKKKQLQNYLH